MDFEHFKKHDLVACEHIAEFQELTRRLAEYDLEESRIWARKAIQFLTKPFCDKDLHRRLAFLCELVAVAHSLKFGDEAIVLLRDRAKGVSFLDDDSENAPESQNPFQTRIEWLRNAAKSLVSRVGDKKANTRLRQFYGDITRADEIRGYFWAQYDRWIKAVLHSMLISRLGEEEAGHRNEEQLTELCEKVLSEESFRTIALSYDPGKRATFKGYFRRRCIQRCIDVTRRIQDPLWRSDDKEVEEVTDDGPDPAQDEQAKLRRKAARHCMKQLQMDAEGEVKLAAFELIHLVYIDPSDYARSTTKLLKSQAAKHPENRTIRGIMSQLRAEYQESCGKENTHDKDLASTKEDLRARTAKFIECQASLYDLKCPFRRILELERLAASKKLGELETEQQETPVGSKKHREIEYMMAFIRMRNAEKRRLKALKIQADWDDCRGRWVRTEQKVGDLLGISQTRAHNLLGISRNFLRDCIQAELDA